MSVRQGLHDTAASGEAARGAAALAAHLAAAPSVTAGLLSWCEARGIGGGPIRVLARAGGDPPPDLAALLDTPGEAVAFRRVVLGRSGIALAEADNIFLPGRLPPAMREALAATDTPFGAVLAPLAPTRETLWRRLGAEAGEGAVLRQVARVRGRDGAMLAIVSERFLPVLAR